MAHGYPAVLMPLLQRPRSPPGEICYNHRDFRTAILLAGETKGSVPFGAPDGHSRLG